MEKPFKLMLCVGLAVSCGGDTPTSTDGRTPNFGMAGNSGCYTVQGTIDETGVPPTFVGTISGDLQGTTVTTALSSSSTGPVNHNALSFAYSITGGIVPELIDKDLQLSTSGLIAAYTQESPDVARINGALSVESPGSGHLTLHGSTDLTGFPPAVLSLEYHGVVCP